MTTVGCVLASEQHLRLQVTRALSPELAPSADKGGKQTEKYSEPGVTSAIAGRLPRQRRQVTIDARHQPRLPACGCLRARLPHQLDSLPAGPGTRVHRRQGVQIGG